MPHSKDDLLKYVDEINVWQKAGKRAPHKPLLILLALSFYSRGIRSSIPFTEIESVLRSLLRKYGPHRHQIHPEYPFWRLQRDGLWFVEADGEMKTRKSNSDPRITELRIKNARGSFQKWVITLLDEMPDLLCSLSTRILNAHFPVELHNRIAHDLELPLYAQLTSIQQKERTFKEAVMNAYSWTCAISGFSLQADENHYGISSSFIKWPQHGGPYKTSNGLALSSLHVDLYNSGLISVSPEYTVCLADSVTLSPSAKNILNASVGKKISLPIDKADWPETRFLHWHYTQIYRNAPVSI